MLIASASEDLKLYDYEKGCLQHSYGNSKRLLKNVDWSSDGKYVLLVGDGTDIDVVSVTDEKVNKVQRVPIEDATYALFQPGTVRNIAVGCRSGKTVIWDVKTRNIIKKFPVATSAVKILDFNSKNTFLAAALESGETNIFSLTSNIIMGTVKVQDSKTVSSLAFHKEFRAVLGIATDEGSILVRDLGTNTNKMFLKIAHGAPVSGIVFSPINCDVMGSCSKDKNILFHDIRLTTTVTTINTNKYFTCMDWICGNLITLGTLNGETLVYDLRKYNKPVNAFKDHRLSVTSVAFQPSIDKHKRNSLMSVSLKETYSPIPVMMRDSPAANKTDSDSLFDIINTTVSNSRDLAIKNVEFNDSIDSFLINVTDSTNASGINNTDNSVENISSLKTKPKVLNSSRFALQSSIEKNIAICGTDSVLSSTPVSYRNQMNEPTPSPIKNVELVRDYNGNSDARKENSIDVKNIVSLNSPSEVDTVCNKCTSNLNDLSNELKNFIRYSVYDVSLLCRNNHCHTTLSNTKNRLFIEDQIYAIHQKMENMQSDMNKLLEENKKLMIELQMLRLSKK